MGVTTWWEAWNPTYTVRDPKPVRVEKFTEAYLWLEGDEGRRTARESQNTKYFDTREAAVEWIVTQCEAEVEGRAVRLARAQINLAAARELKERA